MVHEREAGGPASTELPNKATRIGHTGSIRRRFGSGSGIFIFCGRVRPTDFMLQWLSRPPIRLIPVLRGKAMQVEFEGWWWVTTNDAAMALVSGMAGAVCARWRAIGRRAQIPGVRLG